MQLSPCFQPPCFACPQSVRGLDPNFCALRRTKCLGVKIGFCEPIAQTSPTLPAIACLENTDCQAFGLSECKEGKVGTCGEEVSFQSRMPGFFNFVNSGVIDYGKIRVELPSE